MGPWLEEASSGTGDDEDCGKTEPRLLVDVTYTVEAEQEVTSSHQRYVVIKEM